MSVSFFNERNRSLVIIRSMFEMMSMSLVCGFISSSKTLTGTLVPDPSRLLPTPQPMITHDGWVDARSFEWIRPAGGGWEPMCYFLMNKYI